MPCAANTPSPSPHCRPLPPEIWITIFSHHTSLPHLWSTCRLISPTLRACADRAISAHFLQTVHIEFLLERHNLGGKRKPHELAVPVSFVRVGTGSEEGTALFRGDVRGVVRGKSRDEVVRRWEENVRGWKAEAPGFTVEIGGVVNDTELPGLEVDGAKGEVRVQWRGMLGGFFREERRLGVLRRRRRREESRCSDGEEQPLVPVSGKRRGKIDGLTSSPLPCHDTDLDLLKPIRRTRLAAHYHANPEMLWAIDSLQYFETADTAKWSSASPKMLPQVPGAGLGERWFGSMNLVQELYLDECSSLQRIGARMREGVRGEG